MGYGSTRTSRAPACSPCAQGRRRHRPQRYSILQIQVVIHKLGYLLNSKIVGGRIKNPMWLTLIGIVVGEKLMGVPGIFLAPVVLRNIKVEASQNLSGLELATGRAPRATPSPASSASVLSTSRCVYGRHRDRSRW